jgi:predicted transcriptional regulator
MNINDDFLSMEKKNKLLTDTELNVLKLIASEIPLKNSQ